MARLGLTCRCSATLENAAQVPILLMAQTTFFGLTAYGAGTTYDKTAARPLLFHEIPDDVFVNLFQKHALTQSELALVLQVCL